MSIYLAVAIPMFGVKGGTKINDRSIITKYEAFLFTGTPKNLSTDLRLIRWYAEVLVITYLDTHIVVSVDACLLDYQPMYV